MTTKPLTIRDNPFDKNEILISGRGSARFCGVSKSDPDGEEKAALIVTAVNSHAALVEALKAVDAAVETVGAGSVIIQLTTAEREAIRAALAQIGGA